MLGAMTPGAWWMVAGLGLCAAEMLVPGVFLLPIGAAALLAGGATALLALGGTAQVVVFVALMAALVAIAAWRTRRPQPDVLNAPAAGLVGAVCRAVQFEGGEGRVSLGDGMWPARLASGDAPAPGSLLRVVGLDGTTLLVAQQ